MLLQNLFEGAGCVSATLNGEERCGIYIELEMAFGVMLWYLLIVSSDFTVVKVVNAEYKIISPNSPSCCAVLISVECSKIRTVER